MKIPESELILNEDGSIYHLNLKPEHIADTIITVGDPDRVGKVTAYFDKIEFSIHKREFLTQTGTFKNKRISVISTGIGTDNIDIVLNELDALVNIDFNSRTIKNKLTSLNIIRIGTTGSIQKDIPVDSFIASEFGIGFDNLLHFYENNNIFDKNLSTDLRNHLDWNISRYPYAVGWDDDLGNHFVTNEIYKGITVTNSGFYGPQGRILRLPVADPYLKDKLATFYANGKRITNLEMETAGIYGLAKLLGHKALSLNVVLANRPLEAFSTNPSNSVDRLIRYALDKIVTLA